MAKKQQKNPGLRRTLARLMAVQGLYSQDVLAEEGHEGLAAEVILEKLLAFQQDNMDEAEDEPQEVADTDFLRQLLTGVLAQQAELDGMITAHLGKDWTMKKMGTLMRALLRPAVLELRTMEGVPAPVIIDEYTGIAGSFFGDSEVGFVNAILENIAKDVR